MTQEMTPIPFKVRYFAVLRDEAGVAEEQVDYQPMTAADIFSQLKRRHGFALKESELRVAINGDFSEMDVALSPGDEIVFIPPVSGG